MFHRRRAARTEKPITEVRVMLAQAPSRNHSGSRHLSNLGDIALFGPLLMATRGRGPSKGQRCRGDWMTNVECALGKWGKKTLNSKCKKCKEWRCKDHCKCKYEGRLSGHKQGRSSLAARRVQGVQDYAGPAAQDSDDSDSDASAASEAPQPRAQARAQMPPLSCEAWTDMGWVSRALEDMRTTPTVVMATYSYDLFRFQAMLLSRLEQRANKPFECYVLLDREQLLKGPCQRMQSCTNALLKAGAEIRLGDGKVDGRGNMHLKTLIIGGKIVYHGTGNFTENSGYGWNHMVRITGPPAAVLARGVRDCWKDRRTAIYCFKSKSQHS